MNTAIPCTRLWDPTWQVDQKLDWAKQNPHVCVLPFINRIINVEFDGQRDPSKQKTYLRNSCCCNLIVDNDPSAIDHVKKSVLDGQLNSNCQRCYDSEQQTSSSERTMALVNESAEQFNKFLTTAEVNDSVFGIKFSNLCNLACRSCSPTFSSKYSQVHQLRIPQELVHDIGDNSAVWDDITSSITKILEKQSTITLSLFGGESLIQPGALRLIDWLNEQLYSSRVILNITTNFTNLQTQLVKKFDQFKQIHLFASIDSIEQNYNYVRWPGQWSQIKSNLEQILPQVQAGQIALTVQPLWNLNNIFYIVDYLDWWHNWFDSNNLTQTSIKNVTMFRPFHMTIQNLPAEYRNQLKNLLQQAKNHAIFNNQRHDSLSHFLDGMIDFLSGNDKIYDLFELFLFDTAKHDHANQTRMQVGNKKFYDILSTKHQKMLQDFQSNLTEKSLPAAQRQAYYQLPL